MNNKRLLVLVLIASIFSFNKAFAQDVCSKNGYTILTINGIFTDEKGAIENKDKLKDRFMLPYNNEPVNVDYVYNATHLAGAGDLVDAVRQGLFDSKSDYDLVEMLNSASGKVKTQKLLLVGHSQGNFYANAFYDKVANADGGVPAQSIGMYSVATPDTYVSGGGKYITSDTDTVIAAVVGRLKNIMTPNVHIPLQKIDGNGHSFSDVYLKYRSGTIVSDIKSSFDKLKTNEVKKTGNPCLSPQKMSLAHKIAGALLTAGDFVVNTGVKASTLAVNTVKSLATTLVGLAKNGLALVGLANTQPIATVQKIVEEPQVVLADNITTEDPNITNNQTEEIPTTENTDIDTNIDTNADDNMNTSDTDQNTSQDNTNTSQNNSTTSSSATTTTNDSNNNTSSTNTNNSTTTTNDTSTTPAKIETINKNAPVVTLNGEKDLIYEVGGVYTEYGATALDEVDGVVSVTTSGTVDTTTIGTYTITYTAKDKDLNIGTATRNINIVNTKPVASQVATITYPTSGIYKDDGLDVYFQGKKDFTPFNFGVIYTDVNNNPPASVTLRVKNMNTNLFMPDIPMTHVALGSDVLNDGNYTNGELFTVGDIKYDTGSYFYSFVAVDKNGDYFKTLEELNDHRFYVTPFNYFYVPKYTFGKNNGDGNDWQIWYFNGSNIYGWKDTYVNKYLHEQFKIETYPGGFWCSDCLERGVFISDPQKGFDTSTVITSGLEGSPQNYSIDRIYDVDIQWDSTGYTTTIFHNGLVDHTSHTNIPNMTNNVWVGWDGMQNNFTKFPSGDWTGGPSGWSKTGFSGGQSMVLTPYPIYDPSAIDTTPTPVPVRSSDNIITSFSFESLTPKVNARTINNDNNTVILEVPYGTDVTNLVPTISVSDRATISPASLTPEDFSNGNVQYRVTAEDGSVHQYAAVVVILSKPEVIPDPIVPPVVPDTTLPKISSYTLDGVPGAISTNPMGQSMNIVITANKNVNWMSIKIEKVDNPTIYKMFQSNSTTCVDGTNTCSKIWPGDLSSGGLLQNGDYKIKVHMQDELKNDFDDYLPMAMTIIGQSL